MSVGSLEWRQQAQQVAECAQKTLPDLIGVYVHGSAAFGDLNASSDLDVLVVTDSQIGCEAFSADVLAQARKPRPLELSVVQTQDAVWARPPWRFLRHVNSAQSRVVSGDSVEDPDLAAHYAVTRAVGVAVAGPPATEVFGEVGRADLLVYLQNELEWGLTSADRRYAVLNAARASAYAATGQLMSKLQGATWWADNHDPAPVLREAAQAQRDGRDLGTVDQAGAKFVRACMHHLRTS